MHGSIEISTLRTAEGASISSPSFLVIVKMHATEFIELSSLLMQEEASCCQRDSAPAFAHPTRLQLRRNLRTQCGEGWINRGASDICPLLCIPEAHPGFRQRNVTVGMRHPGNSIVDLVSESLLEVITVANKLENTQLVIASWINRVASEMFFLLCAVTRETSCWRGLIKFAGGEHRFDETREHTVEFFVAFVINHVATEIFFSLCAVTLETS